MIDTTAILQMAIIDFGQPATIGGAEIEHGVLFNPPPAQADPYRADPGHDGPTANLLLTDLVALDEWPLVSKDFETDEQLYRVVRASNLRGEVTLYLREAE